MSQKKMDAYKYAKKNHKEIEKKQKRKRVIGWICGIVIALAVIGSCSYLIYYTNVLKPKNDAAKAAAALSQNSVPENNEDMANDVMDIINPATDGTSTDADNAVTVPASDTVEVPVDTDNTADSAVSEAPAPTDSAAETPAVTAE